VTLLSTLPEGLTVVAFWILTGASFATSFITAALGIGGGALLLAIMAILLPPTAMIPVHGVVQLGSNAGRLGMLWRQVHGPALRGFVIGSIVGASIGGAVVVELSPRIVQAGIGIFVIWSVLFRPPKWLGTISWLTGGISALLTMFFGATGLFVANYTKSFGLPRHDHVATHAALMTVQHGLKVAVFGVLGFAFWPWAGVILVLVLAGLAGTYSGKLALNRMTDHGFKRALDILLILISLRLIWAGIMG
jgi:uncharacterized membrane protein YfcA